MVPPIETLKHAVASRANGTRSGPTGEPTPLRRLPELGDALDVPGLLVKDESANVLGTHKDRKSRYILANLRSLAGGARPDALCIMTAGNAGLSLATLAAAHGLPVVAFVNAAGAEVERRLRGVCARVVRLDNGGKVWTPQELCRLAGDGPGHRVVDATNLASAYHHMALEIAPHRPDAIVLPVGSGELFMGLFAGLEALGIKTRMIGVTVGSPDTLADKLYAVWSPYRARIRRLAQRNPLCRLVQINDNPGLRETFHQVRTSLLCEPSSALPFHALRTLGFAPGDRVLVVNTGRSKAIPEDAVADSERDRSARTDHGSTS